MSSSVRKDIFRVIAIRKVPPHLTMEEFRAKLERMADELLLLPQYEQKVLKLEMLFSNDRFDGHLEPYGYPSREPMAVAVMQIESAENLIAIMKDTEVQKTVQRAGLPAEAYAFGIDVHPLIDRDSRVAPSDRVRLMGIYEVPEHISKEEYGQGFDRFSENFTAIPAVQKNIVKFEKWTQNDALEEGIRALSLSTPKTTFILNAEFEAWDNVTQFQDAETLKVTTTAKRDFGFNNQASAFHADVVTKVDKF
ncbi:hypothetical protein C8R45DRAFT_1014203 [Mycena sanguinolenta]|nr:hypothetical protein C8R45DRAFT_1014203 [Mycena sanguinolenta]